MSAAAPTPGSSTPAAAAGAWRLGEIEVNRVGFGTMRLTGTLPFHEGEPRDHDASVAVLRRAVELGVNHVDTAAFYFGRTRSALELVNSALTPYDDITVATKVGPVRDIHGEWATRPTPAELRGHVEENLRQLGRDELDLVYYRVGRGDGDLTEYVGALRELVGAGLIRHLGVSGVSLEQLRSTQQVAPIVAVQNRVSQDVPGDREVLEYCGEQGIAFVPFFSISGSQGKGRPDDGGPADEVGTVARELGATPAQVKLAWSLALGPHVLVIPGTGDIGHLEQNVAAGALRLSDDQLARLGAAAPPSR